MDSDDARSETADELGSSSRTPLVQVPGAVLIALMEAADAPGPRANPHSILFKAGRDWGYADERDVDRSALDPRERLLAGIKLLAPRDLAQPELIEFRYTRGGTDCFITCRLTLPPGLERASQREPQDRPLYLLAVGYLTGWLASMTGLDISCHPQDCSEQDPQFCCSFQPRTAPHNTGGPWTQSTGNSASHFILDSMTGSLAGKELALEDLVESTLDTVMFLDLDDTIQFWNQGATLMFQYERAEIVGQTVGLLLPRDLIEAGELESLKELCDHQGVVHNHITRRLRKDSRELWVSLTRTALHDYRGEPIGAVAILRDITEQRAREEEHRRSKHLASVGELAAMVAHEVKNPLTGIYAALQVLEGQLDTDDPRREIFGSIGQEVIRLNDFTQGLLDFARPPAPKLSQGNLSSFLVDLVRDLERLALVEQSHVQLELDPVLDVQFDRDLTARVFQNLILNALQAMRGKGTVNLRSVHRSGWVIIDVSDNGPGIPAARRASVFEPFFTTKAKGTGLGLAIARKNIEAQGGTIRLRRQRSHGATFRDRKSVV